MPLFGYEAKFTAAWFLPKIVSGLFVFNYRGPEITGAGQTGHLAHEPERTPQHEKP